MLARRSFFGAAGAVLAAPAIVRTPGLLMPVPRRPRMPQPLTFREWLDSLPARLTENHVFQLKTQVAEAGPIPIIYGQIPFDRLRF